MEGIGGHLRHMGLKLRGVLTGLGAVRASSQIACPPRSPEADRCMPVVLFGVTAALTARCFLRGQLGHLRKEGWNVHFVVGEDTDMGAFAIDEGVTGHVVQMQRRPAPRQDVRSAWQVLRVVRHLRPDIIVMGTPKMSLFGLVAGFVCRVPRRVYLLHGLRLEGAAGVSRTLLGMVERLVMGLATEVVPVSLSLGSEVRSRRLTRTSKLTILGHGSANGVDIHYFRPASEHARAAAKREYGIPPDARVLLYVGRLVADKGIEDLLALWDRLSTGIEDLWLLIVGAPEIPDKAARATEELHARSRVVVLGAVDDVRKAYAAAEVQVLLTRREGLPTVVLEAGSCAVPTVANAVTGTVDAIQDGVTGTLVTAGDVDAACSAVAELVVDPEKRRRMGRLARQFVAERYNRELVSKRWTAFLDDAESRPTEHRLARRDPALVQQPRRL